MSRAPAGRAEGDAVVDPEPPATAEPPPAAGRGAAPYRLPTLRRPGELPVSHTAPRIPRALRAFNGMPPAPAAPPADRSAAPPARPGRAREALTIRALLEQPGDEVEESGRLAVLRTALGRLRRRREEHPD